MYSDGDDDTVERFKREVGKSCHMAKLLGWDGIESEG
jgi:hypothetical protein